ncbi:MAG TPA: hypothetical protein VK668_10300 [Mucilaginibacter sp.]|nr:hypothetical protein [Mucilaginibacter sp.]
MLQRLLKLVLVLSLLFAVQVNATAGNSRAGIKKQTTDQDIQTRLKSGRLPLDTYAEVGRVIHIPVFKTSASPGYAFLPEADLITYKKVTDLRSCRPATIQIFQYYRQILFPFHVFW